MRFKIMSKVVKYTCRLRLYNYPHDQLNTRHFIIIFGYFFEGGGAQNLTLPPGTSYPRYATVEIDQLREGVYNISVFSGDEGGGAVVRAGGVQIVSVEVAIFLEF